MVVKADCDAAYLVASKARSRTAGFIYMGNHEENQQIINGPIMVIAQILKRVVASAAEADDGALYHATQEIVPLQMTAIKLGHPQPAEPICTNNSTALGIMNGTIKQRRSKAIAMRF